jgi:hypothetical protein
VSSEDSIEGRALTDARPHDNPLPDGVNPALLDAEERVAADVRCIECGYNLRTLAARQRCPECGQPVAPSLYRPELAHAPMEWVRGLANGAAVLSAAGGMTLMGLTLLTVAAVARLFGAVVVSAILSALPWVLVGLIGPIVGVIGLHMLTAPDPRPPRGPERLSFRRVTRWSLIGGVILIGAAFAKARWGPTALPFYAILCVSGVVAMLLLAHTMVLARRARAPRLADLAKVLAWSAAGLIGVVLVGACLSSVWPALGYWGEWVRVFGVGASFVVLVGCELLFIRMERALRDAVGQVRAGALGGGIGSAE